jgi:hypothetical protein
VVKGAGGPGAPSVRSTSLPDLRDPSERLHSESRHSRKPPHSITSIMESSPDGARSSLDHLVAAQHLSRASNYTAIPKRAKPGDAELEDCSRVRSRMGRNRRASSFGPNGLRAIATSGDKCRRPSGWDSPLPPK